MGCVVYAPSVVAYLRAHRRVWTAWTPTIALSLNRNRPCAGYYKWLASGLQVRRSRAIETSG